MFVLVHVSDPHIGPLPRPRLGELMSKRLLGYANWLRRRRRIHRLDILDALTRDLLAQPRDHVAVTGDLINIALPDEFARARAWLERLGSPADVTLVPGNHDAYVADALPALERRWAAFMQGDAAGGAGEEAARFPFVRRRGPVALVGLSTARPTPLLSSAGLLGAEQTARAADLLRGLAAEGLFRVVLIHHPPQRHRGSPHKRLIDAAPLREMLAQAGAELILHGHDHRPGAAWLDGPGRPIPSLGVPSASASPDGHDAPAGYNLCFIAGAPGAWTCEVVARGFARGGTRITETRRETLSPRGQA